MTVILKYNIDDIVYFINKKGKIQQGIITSCYFKKRRVVEKGMLSESNSIKIEKNYLIDDIKFPYTEEALFSSKEELTQDLLK